MRYHAVGSAASVLIEKAGLDVAQVVAIVTASLDEDLAYGPDVTTAATVPDDQWVAATVSARAPGVLAGMPVAIAVLDLVIGAGQWRLLAHASDGTRVGAGEPVLSVEAPTAGLLTAERTALNFLGHLSGIASTTALWADAVRPARVRDTRKTVPGLRVLAKYAVRCGGGVNHRMGLGDAALVKDNHIVAAGGVAEAVDAVRSAAPGLPLEVECDRVQQVAEALACGVEEILLDNMTLEQMRQAVALRSGSADVRFEASGGLTLDRAADVAATGVDFVAVGALTHSAPVLDLGLDVQRVLADRVEQ